MTTFPTLLRLEPVTEDDIQDLTSLWYAAFSDPASLKMFPDTPTVRQWWDDANRADLRNKPFRRYLKVVDTTASTTEKNKIVAYAKWDLSTTAVEQRGDRFPPFPAEGEHDLRKAKKLEKERERVVGGRLSYYLDMLVTHPDYERRGAGWLLVQWGCEQADKDGVAAYIDASAVGKGLYSKFGFEDRSDPAFSVPGIYSMVREPRKREA